MLNIEKVAERIRELTNGYLIRFGQMVIGLYRFSDAAKISDWTTYLSVVKITLDREGQRPAHLWVRNGNDCLLLLCVNGYFRTDLNDVTDIMRRLWILRATYDTMPVLIQEWKTNSANSEEVICGIYQTLGKYTFEHGHGYRKHWFGSSVI